MEQKERKSVGSNGVYSKNADYGDQQKMLLVSVGRTVAPTATYVGRTPQGVERVESPPASRT